MTALSSTSSVPSSSSSMVSSSQDLQHIQQPLSERRGKAVTATFSDDDLKHRHALCPTRIVSYLPSLSLLSKSLSSSSLSTGSPLLHQILARHLHLSASSCPSALRSPEAASATSAKPASSLLLGGAVPAPPGEKPSLGSPLFVRASISGLKQGVKKVNLVAKLVRGMRVEDALMQMAVSPKRAAKVVAQMVHAARANAVQNHGLDGSSLIVAEAYVSKGRYLRRSNPHGRGKSGVKHRPRCGLTVLVREMNEEEHLKRTRMMKSRQWRKRTSKLLPHRVIEVGGKRKEDGGKDEEVKPEVEVTLS